MNASSSLTARDAPPPRSAWVGMVVGAGALLVLAGAFHCLAGVVAIFGDGSELMGPERLGAGFDDNTWGVLCFAFGVLEIAAGYGVFLGDARARAIAIVVAMANAVLTIVFTDLPTYAKVLAVVVDAAVIYAVAAHGAEVRPDE